MKCIVTVMQMCLCAQGHHDGCADRLDAPPPARAVHARARGRGPEPGPEPDRTRAPLPSPSLHCLHVHVDLHLSASVVIREYESVLWTVRCAHRSSSRASTRSSCAAAAAAEAQRATSWTCGGSCTRVRSAASSGRAARASASSAMCVRFLPLLVSYILVFRFRISIRRLVVGISPSTSNYSLTRVSHVQVLRNLKVYMEACPESNERVVQLFGPSKTVADLLFVTLHIMEVRSPLMHIRPVYRFSISHCSALYVLRSISDARTFDVHVPIDVQY